MPDYDRHGDSFIGLSATARRLVIVQPNRYSEVIQTSNHGISLCVAVFPRPAGLRPQDSCCTMTYLLAAGARRRPTRADSTIRFGPIRTLQS
ncbi:hypothetical protein ANDA3_0112 [plant metagenome]|uniref:Uncharacterized protein n=1 Tax=plant metagenome TaxID=1297885 RepID=A0A484QTQ9_9ZZZZ